LSRFAHDLRGPLANLSLLVEAIEARGKSAGDSKLGALADRAAKVIDRLDDMMNALLTRARAAASAQPCEAASVSLPDIVETAAELNQPLAERCGVRLHCFLVEPLCVTGDAELLMQAVDNLLTNAIKYSRRGGMVVCQAAAVGNEAVLRIEDEGPGLKPEDMRRLFRPFQRASATSDAPLGSAGIGLSIVHDIAVQHGGSISAANRSDGRGAVLTLRLPAAPS
jgi:signal transduction histidine kinase